MEVTEHALLAIVEPALRIAVFTARLASRPPPISLPLPVGTAAIRDSWQAPRSGGRRHEGIDLFAPEGTPVRSTTIGLVARVGSNRLGGKVVWVIGPGGQRHYYAHLARFAAIHAGQPIAAGDLLGHVGTTGNARGTPPHLHYGIYTTRGAINPYPLLRAGTVNETLKYSSPRRKPGSSSLLSWIPAFAGMTNLH